MLTRSLIARVDDVLIRSHLCVRKAPAVKLIPKLATLPGHVGIDGIRERLSRRNGCLTYESRPGQTYARIEIPLPHENATGEEKT